jgi:hypothetical protein
MEEMMAAFDVGITSLKYVAGKLDESIETGICSERTYAENLSSQIAGKVKELEEETKGKDRYSFYRLHRPYRQKTKHHREF